MKVGKTLLFMITGLVLKNLIPLNSFQDVLVSRGMSGAVETYGICSNVSHVVVLWFNVFGNMVIDMSDFEIMGFH